MRKIFDLLLVTPLLSFCSAEESPQQGIVVVDPIEVTHHNYYEVENYNVVWSKVFDIDLPEYFVYFYSPTCSHCAEIKDWIIETALERKDIYFAKASENDVIKQDVSKTIGIRSSKDLAILGYPTLIKIFDGTLINNVAGKTKIQQLIVENN